MAFNHASLVRPNSFKLIHEIGQALDKGLESDLIYLDFEKAFDSVCHTKLLAKLECYGICHPLLKWFKRYLHGHLQRVVINGLCSAWKHVKSRVPQGFLLGLILFLIYVDDMPNVTTGSTLAMFADDSKCYKCIESIADFDIIQADLDKLLCLSLANEMNFQPSKCENLRVSRKRISPVHSYSLDSTSLKVVSSVKDLGIMVTKDLTWSNHVRYVSATANHMLGFIKTNCAGIINKDVLKLLYVSLVCSHLCQHQTSMLIMEVERVQRRASQFICKNNKLSYKDRLISLNLLPIILP